MTRSWAVTASLAGALLVAWLLGAGPSAAPERPGPPRAIVPSATYAAALDTGRRPAGAGGLRVRRASAAPAKVLDLAPRDGGAWIATGGAGLFGLLERGPAHHDIGSGLPSAVVLQVEVAPDGRLFVGTERGLTVIDPKSGAARRPLSAAVVGERLADGAADLVVVSQHDGSAVVQLSETEVRQETEPVSGLWKLRGGEIAAWGQEVGGLAQATAGAYDARSRCIYVAGVRPAGAQSQPWVLRDCGGKVSPWFGSESGVVGVAAVARDPVRGEPVLALVVQRTPDPATRRYRLVRAGAEGTLEPFCAGGADETDEITGLVADPRHDRLLVARYAAGVRALDCTPAPSPGPPAPRGITALELDAHGRIWVGGIDGAFVLDKVGAVPRRVLEPAAGAPWIDALPWQVGAEEETVLVTSSNEGAAELKRVGAHWEVQRAWRARHELPGGVFGPAAYAGGGGVWLSVKSQGLLRLRSDGVRRLGPAEGLLSSQVLHVVGSAEGSAWVAFGTTPVERSGGLQLLRDDKPTAIQVRYEALDSVGDLLAWQDGGVWAATRLGVVGVDARGGVTRLSTYAVTGLFRSETTGEVAAVGSTVERWTKDSGFSPVLFALPRSAGALGHPVDVVVDRGGRWVLLYSSGRLVLLDEQRRFVAVLGADEGVPPSSRKLLYLPRSNEILVGSAHEGLFVAGWDPGG